MSDFFKLATTKNGPRDINDDISWATSNMIHDTHFKDPRYLFFFLKKNYLLFLANGFYIQILGFNSAWQCQHNKPSKSFEQG